MARFQAQGKDERKRAAGLGFMLPLTLAACGGSGSGASSPPPAPAPAPPPPPQTVQGSVFLGPVEGATVFYDENGNGLPDTGETSVISDADGNFSIIEGSGDLLAIGGVDTLYGFDFAGEAFEVPAGGTILSPLTTLLKNATNQDNFLNDTGLRLLETLDTSFDVLTYSPFAPENAGNADLNDLLIFMNQAALITFSLVRTVGELTGNADPVAFALELVANNLEAVPDGTVGVLTDDSVVQALAQALVDTDVITGRSAQEVAEALENLVGGYAILLGENAEPADSTAVRAILQEAIVNVEALIQDLADNGGVLPKDFPGLFPDGSDFADEVNDLGNQIALFGENAFIAARAGGVVNGTAQNDFIRGRLGNDTLVGADGDDFISGEGGEDSLSGGNGDDTLVKRFGSGSIDGGDGNDFIIVERAAVDIDGGAGSDGLSFRGTERRGEFTNELEVSVDLVDQVYSVGFEGSEAYSRSISGVEFIEFLGPVDLNFRGTDALEIIRVASGTVTVMASGGDDEVSRIFTTTSLTVNVDFSLVTSPVDVTFGVLTDTLDYGFGSISIDGDFADIIGTDQGDTFTLLSNIGVVFLGDGADVITIAPDALISNTFISTFENFAATGDAQDKIDLSLLVDRSDMFATVDDVLDNFIQTSSLDNDGNEVPLAVLRITDGITGTDFRFSNVMVTDIGAENLILPSDVV